MVQITSIHLLRFWNFMSWRHEDAVYEDDKHHRQTEEREESSQGLNSLEDLGLQLTDTNF